MGFLKRFFSNNPASQSGVSLVSTMFMMLVISIFVVGGLGLYNVWNHQRLTAQTGDDIELINQALKQYVTEHGNYPCPASLTAPIDSTLANNPFGVAADDLCTEATVEPGTFRQPGRDLRPVRIGAVPVRTLGLPDSFMFDPYKKRYIYAVTEAYADEGTVTNGDMGAIRIIDGENRDATSVSGNIVHTLYSMGTDNNGAYNMAGNVIEACRTVSASGSSLLSAENCDFSLVTGGNATFRNTLAKRTGTNNSFTQKVSYATSMTPPCENTGTSPYKDIAFLLDTSGSMAEDPGQEYCPAGMEGCSRMDLARWALRRVLPTRIYNNQDMTDAGKTLFTGFVAYGNTKNVEKKLGDPTFDDPTSTNYKPPSEDAVNSQLESKLQNMCPSGSTPLGIHMEALANKIGNGTEKQPNKIIVLSDGLSNDGKSPLDAARDLKVKYPYLQVDIIDLVGNNSMKQVAETTGGKYFRTNNASELIGQFEASMKLCKTVTAKKPPVDKRGCGSGGHWGN